MAGYNWSAGKSNNAVSAEDAGLRVRSKITREWLQSAGISEGPAFIKWLIAKGAILPEEWHHTSKMFNQTEYFSAESIREQLQARAEAPATMGGSLEWLRAEYAQR